MRKLRGLVVVAFAGILGLSFMGLATSPATAVQSSSVVVADASTEMALLGGGDVEVLSVQCASLCPYFPAGDCVNSNCGIATPDCCCKWCNGALDCRKKGLPGFCYAE